MNPRSLIAAAGIALVVAGCGQAATETPPTPTLSPTPTASSPKVVSPAATTRPTPTTTAPRPRQTATSSPRQLPARLLGKDWERIPTTRKVVALTFDGGASDDAVTSILTTLQSKNVPGTFFLTGDFVKRFPGAVRDIAGVHRLGNHSATHPAFTDLTTTEIRDELLSAERSIRTVAGTTPRPLFRFPLGDRDARTIRAVNDVGYVAVRWTVDTLGWQGTSGGRSAASVKTRVLDALQPGEIVLMHVGAHPKDGSTLDADALPGVIDAIRDRGYGFVTLDALLREQTEGVQFGHPAYPR